MTGVKISLSVLERVKFPEDLLTKKEFRLQFDVT